MRILILNVYVLNITNETFENIDTKYFNIFNSYEMYKKNIPDSDASPTLAGIDISERSLIDFCL